MGCGSVLFDDRSMKPPRESPQTHSVRKSGTWASPGSIEFTSEGLASRGTRLARVAYKTMDLPAALKLLETRVDETPRTESALQDLLADAIRESGEPDVQFEAPSGSKRIDLLAGTAGIEIKYHKPIPSGTNRPMTMQYGQLLADLRKLAGDQRLTERYLVLITDREGYNHVSNKNLLPTAWDRKKPISALKINGLAATAKNAALGNGPWIDIAAQMIWSARSFGPDRMRGLAWRVTLSPVSGSDPEIRLPAR